MASTSPTPSAPDWVARWPEAFAIVTGFIKERKPKGGVSACRPLLVTQVLRSRVDGSIALRVAHGTSKTKFPERANIDLIIQNISDLDECGLMTPTRFVVDPQDQFILKWNADNFRPWGGCSTPRRGRLPESLQREYAWLMMQYLPK